jgi:hypothetical protein
MVGLYMAGVLWAGINTIKWEDNFQAFIVVKTFFVHGLFRSLPMGSAGPMPSAFVAIRSANVREAGTFQGFA